jgi:chromosome segregation ATPase
MDVEKTMEFILAQQAAYAAHQEAMAAHQDAMAARQAQLAARQDTFDERLARLNAFQDSQQKSIYDLLQVVRGLATHATETDQKIDRLSDKIDGLTDNMNALIQVVDGLVRRDNGRPSA